MSSSASFVLSPEDRDEYNNFLFSSTGSSNGSSMEQTTPLPPKIKFRLKSSNELKITFQEQEHEQNMRDLAEMIERFKLNKAWKYLPVKKWNA
ncbi:hypothetical protein QR680_010758 [Steinernema hermaphroditum]|uniref:Uncharacterized protein n=1 Tax=Steinernema hermaphroditum TaxID=289476 RepID=A0AA39MC80_9BILA|nr:hypothetical protein QR680_010758 [Steinernema hermaphroditum]